MDLLPAISPEMQAVIRSAYGVLLILLLFLTLPMSRWFFTSERWGGYAESRPEVDWIQNPIARPLVMVIWFVCGIMLIAGIQTVLTAFVTLLLCRYFFIQMRWRGILRGMGAPGFMTYWLAACVFGLELARAYEPGGRLLSLALLVSQVDYAVIMFCSGCYKAVAGYRKGYGMELGMVNPYWGYWWRFYKNVRPTHPMFRMLNHSAWFFQMLAGVLMLAPTPATRFIGGLIMIGSFLFIATHIRLGVLCEMVMVGGLLFFAPGTIGERILTRIIPAPLPGPQVLPHLPSWVLSAVAGFYWLYLALLLPSMAGLWHNFLGRRRLPGIWQKLLDRWTNLFGIILWRVFTVDVINFFARVWVRDREGKEHEYTKLGQLDWGTRFRYIHVGEFVCLASLFTTLKYYPSNWEIFRQRLVRYARTIPCPSGGIVRFEYCSVVKRESGYDFTPVADFVVDPAAGTVEEITRDPSVSVRAAHEFSPVHEGARPGSYAPLEADARR